MSCSCQSCNNHFFAYYCVENNSKNSKEFSIGFITFQWSQSSDFFVESKFATLQNTNMVYKYSECLLCTKITFRAKPQPAYGLLKYPLYQDCFVFIFLLFIWKYQM